MVLDQRSASVWLVGQELQIGDERRLFANLVCMDPRLFPVFTLLVEEVLRRSSIAEDPLQAVFATLDDWRALLRSRADVPTWETLVGLRGELDVLHQLVVSNGAPAVNTWTGPMRSRFDFTGPASVLEIKTTVSQTGFTIHVSSLRQLTPPIDQRLAIVHLRLEENQSGPSVHELVQLLLSLGCDRSPLFDRLDELGYDEHNEGWGRGFNVLQQSAWEVTSDFPGLREDRFSAPGLLGVQNLQYEFDLACAGDAMNEQQMEACLDALVTGVHA